jgi:hypothetical protein
MRQTNVLCRNGQRTDSYFFSADYLLSVSLFSYTSAIVSEILYLYVAMFSSNIKSHNNRSRFFFL